MWKDFILREIAYILRAFRKIAKIQSPTLRDLAIETIILCPSEEGELPSAVTLSGHAKRATASFSGSLSENIEYATMTNCTHAATVAYRLENVVYDNGCLYKGFLAEHISSLGGPEIKPKKYAESMYLCSSQSGSVYFGDWLISDNLLEILAQNQGIEPLKVRPHTNYPHLSELNNLLNLKGAYSEGVIHIKDLFLISDVGYNDSKRKRLATLRSNLRKNSRPSKSAHSDFVYITRGASYRSNRGMVNEPEVIRNLLSRGFLILDPTKHSANEILESILDCSVVVGIEGSQLAYGFLALKKGGIMLTLQPPYRFQPSFRPRCEAVNISWGFIVGNEVEGGFSINTEEINEVLNNYLNQ